MSELTDFRKAKDEVFGSDHHSPLTHEQQESFDGLSYYDEDPDLRHELEVERFDKRERIEMQTSTGDVAEYTRWGKASFLVNGERAELTLYKAEGSKEFFLPFADATSGEETYASGRYLDPSVLANGKVLVDFNHAYSPYCAYNQQWSCPLTPFENRLRVAIRAGEKDFKPA